MLIRTTIGVGLLLLSLGLQWNSVGTTTDQLFPLLAVIAALGACLVDLVLRPEITGHTFDDRQRQLFRLLLITPLGVVVLWAAIATLAKDEALAFGIPVALVGALVGATGTRPNSTEGGWTTTGLAMLGFSALALLVAAVMVVVSSADIAPFAGGQFWLLVVATILPLLWLAAIAARLALVGGSADPRTVATTLWLAATLGAWLVVSRLVIGSQLSPTFEGMGSLAVFSLTIGGIGLLAAGLACLLTPSRTRLLRAAPARAWVEATRSGLRLVMTAHLLMVVMIALMLIATSGNSFGTPDRGAPVWLLVLHLLGAAAAAMATSTLQRDRRLGRTQLFVYAAAFSLAHWLTYATADSQAVVGFTVHDALTMLGPVALASLLLLPRAVRDELGTPRVPAALRGTPVQHTPRPE